MSTTNIPTIFVDDREPPDSATRIAAYGIPTKTIHLNAGDYMFVAHEKKILIERKTISDLLGSLASHRLVTQSHRMLEDCDSVWLLREGGLRRGNGNNVSYYNPADPRSDKKGWVSSRWNWNSFNGMMIDLQLMGVHIVDAPILGDYASTIAYLALNISKEDHRWIQERERPSIITISPQYRNNIWALCAFTGIGPELSEGLVQEVGTFAGVILLAANDPDKLASIKINGRRVGKKAYTLHEEVTKEW